MRLFLRADEPWVVEDLPEVSVGIAKVAGVDPPWTVGFRGEDAARRPWVIGSGLDIWEIIQMLDDFSSIERLADETQLTERQVRLAIAYRDSYPEEIAEAVAQNRRTAEEWHELYPFIETSPAA